MKTSYYVKETYAKSISYKLKVKIILCNIIISIITRVVRFLMPSMITNKILL